MAVGRQSGTEADEAVVLQDHRVCRCTSTLLCSSRTIVLIHDEPGVSRRSADVAGLAGAGQADAAELDRQVQGFFPRLSYQAREHG